MTTEEKVAIDEDGEAKDVERLRRAGCVCPRPLVGHRMPTFKPRCRLCNVEVEDE
jgi:hypothetical protein